MSRSNIRNRFNNDENSFGIPSKIPLKPAELTYLRTLGPLVDAWGYRAGKNGNHTKFEYRTHTGSGNGSWRAVQEITDIVFRNIQQVVYREQTFVFADDIIPKLRVIMSFRDNGCNTYACLPPLLPVFLTEFVESSADAKKMMTSLAGKTVNAQRSSIGYFAIVSAAKALVLFSRGEIPRGLKLLEEAARQLGIR
jgi:hypothetical protein